MMEMGLTILFTRRYNSKKKTNLFIPNYFSSLNAIFYGTPVVPITLFCVRLKYAINVSNKWAY